MLFGGCNCGPGSLVSAYGLRRRRRRLRVGDDRRDGGQCAHRECAGARPRGAGGRPARGTYGHRQHRDPVRAAGTRYGVTIERRVGGNLTYEAPPRTALNGEWGLSMLAQSHRSGEERNVLVDSGYTPEALLNNMAILKLDPATFDALA